MIKYKTILFDLDGTLLNTLFDIQVALNYALKQININANYQEEDVIHFIGSGVHVLIKRACEPFCLNEEQKQIVFNEYMSFYHVHHNDHTQKFDYVLETLKELKEMNIQLGVISNKPHSDAIGCVQYYFSDIFDFIQGGSDAFSPKPSAEVFSYLKDKYLLEKEKTLYVGDMDVDVLFAKNVGMDVAIYSQGFGRIKHNIGQKYTFDTYKNFIEMIGGN